MRRVFAALAVGLTAAAHAAHDGHAQLGATAAFDAAGGVLAAYKDGSHVVVRRSADLGRTWSTPRRVNAVPEPVAAEGEARPKIAAGARGEVYVTWTRPLSRPYTGEIRFARADDVDAPFSAPVTVHTDRQEITHRFDALSVGPGGRLYVAWIDKRDLELAKRAGAAYAGAAVYVAVSDDGGRSFRGDFKLADHSCECCRIALLPEADGGLLALWRHVFEPNIRDHALARLDADGNATPLRRVTFDDWRIDACPHHGPSLGRDEAGRLHAVWFSGAPGRSGVFYARLGENAPPPRPVGDDTAAHADLAVSGSRLLVAWKSFDGERTHLEIMRSDDGGETWRTRKLSQTDGPSDQPRALTHADRFFVFWNTAHEPLSMHEVE